MILVPVSCDSYTHFYFLLILPIGKFLTLKEAGEMHRTQRPHPHLEGQEQHDLRIISVGLAKNPI